MGEQIESGAQPTRAERARADVRALMDTDVSYQDWELDLAERKSFYVRGFTWFRGAVLRELTHLAMHGSKMQELLQARPAWTATPHQWDNTFSYRQALDASWKHPIKFVKAAQTILLCEAAAIMLNDKTGKHHDLVYENMRIEPAVHYINEFNRAVLERIVNENTDMIDILIRETGQKTSAVFYDMADGSTVTKRLADRTHAVIRKYCPRIRIGSVDQAYSKRYKRTSTNENLD